MSIHSAPEYQQNGGHLVEQGNVPISFDPNQLQAILPILKLRKEDNRTAALKITNGPAKSDSKPSAGSPIPINDIIKHILKFDPQNLSGSIQPALQMVQNILQKGGAGNGNPFQMMNNMVGSNLFSQFQSIIAMASQNSSQGNSPTTNYVANNTPIANVGDPCQIYSDNVIANGTVMLIGGIISCVPLISNAQIGIVTTPINSDTVIVYPSTNQVIVV